MFFPPPLHVLIPSLQFDGENARCSAQDMRKLIYLVLVNIYVNEEWYLSTYPDVADSVSAQKIGSGTDHYRQSGYEEGRMPAHVEVDEQWYLRQYSDLCKEYENGTLKDLAFHYHHNGYGEGRLPRAIPVDEHWYLQTYPKARLRVERGVSKSASDDFVRFGYFEGFLPFRPITHFIVDENIAAT